MATEERNSTWDLQGIPDQTGRVVLVTGANSGTGFETALVLAGRGATVVLACRSLEKGLGAKERIRAAHPAALVEVEQLDLGSLASIRTAAEAFRTRHGRLDLLINNAGVMIPPYQTTADGFELQFGTNHLGHFAFTGLLLDLLLSTPGARIVTMSSGAHKFGKVQFEDLQFAKGYRPWAAYAQSKLANLMFTYELQRRLEGSGHGTVAVAAHPGWARTGLQRYMKGAWLTRTLSYPLEGMLSQDSAGGALPLLRAAVDPQARGGEYFGPSGCLEFKGAPRQVRSTPRSRDLATQQRLWRLSEELTGVAYPV